MTQFKPVREPSFPPPGPLPEPAVTVESGPSAGRLIGVDLARALAVFGMFAVHVGPRSPGQGVPPLGEIGEWPLFLAEGRSSVLFATLAGFSMMLIAGRREPKTGLAGRQARARLLIRAVTLLVLGTAMASVFGEVVIINFYGVFFLLALPLVQLPAKTLAIIASVLAVVTPPVAFGLRLLLNESITQSINAYDPLERISGVGVLDLFLTGFYPAITWMPFVITGMALGRLDLATDMVRRRLAALGAALVVLGYGTSWLLFKLFDDLQAARTGGGTFPADSGSVPLSSSSSSGVKAGEMAWMLLDAGPHSGTSFDIIGSLGAAITVIVCATVAMARLLRLRRLASPIIAVGTMSLSAYVGHFIVMSLLLDGSDQEKSYVPLVGLIAGALLFAAIWSRFFRRGPLEYLLNLATKPAQFVR
ncbi:MAG: hypothetical protein QG608_420 [Actinomycetota bacterium]|nr:hypothetical protein [Actinomycetota bacterium]